MRFTVSRRLLVPALIVGGLAAVALWPAAVPVDVAPVTRGPLTVTVDEEGMTRVRERFLVSAPVAGRVLRIELEPGDAVQRGQVIATLRAETPPLLDARSRAEAAAAVDSARATLGRARAEEQRARAVLSLARQELRRVQALVEQRVVSQQERETREADVRVAEESATGAAFAVRTADAELQRAQARLATSATARTGRVVPVIAPVDGVVLKRLHESEAVVPSGEPLVELGDHRALEIVSDLLSADAVRVRPGARAIVEQWGGEPLAARVRRIEPSGFMKVSPLGVEEQRVNVILDFCDGSALALGDAYRVDLRIVLWESADVLRVPTGALFREGGQWAVYVADRGRARRRQVELGHQAGDAAEVLSGLQAGESVILHPGDTIADAGRIRVRTSTAP